jgi:hypothetical protein
VNPIAGRVAILEEFHAFMAKIAGIAVLALLIVIGIEMIRPDFFPTPVIAGIVAGLAKIALPIWALAALVFGTARLVTAPATHQPTREHAMNQNQTDLIKLAGRHLREIVENVETIRATIPSYKDHGTMLDTKAALDIVALGARLACALELAQADMTRQLEPDRSA